MGPVKNTLGNALLVLWSGSVEPKHRQSIACAYRL